MHRKQKYKLIINNLCRMKSPWHWVANLRYETSARARQYEIPGLGDAAFFDDFEAHQIAEVPHRF